MSKWMSICLLYGVCVLLPVCVSVCVDGLGDDVLVMSFSLIRVNIIEGG